MIILEGWVNFNVFFGCPTNQFDATSFILSDKMTKQPARLSTMDLDALYFKKENWWTVAKSGPF